MVLMANYEPIKNTIQAKFRGVPFFVKTETHEGGRKLAIHEYPGSDNRFVEDLGKRAGIFRVVGYVGGERSAQEAKRLVTALEDDTEGILEMSVFGILKVKPHTYSRTVNQTELGIIRFSIAFLVTDTSSTPKKAASSVETVASAAIAMLEKIQEWYAENYIVPEGAEEALVAGYDTVTQTTTIADKIRALGQDVDSVTKLSNDIRDNIADLIRDPIAYGASVFNEGLLGTVFDTVLASREALSALSKLTRSGYNAAIDFKSIKDGLLSNALAGFDIPQFADDARYRLTSNSNRLVITNGIRTAVFASYMSMAASINYVTDSEIDDVIADINECYMSITLTSSIGPLIALKTDQCRIETLNVLEEKIQTTPKIIEYTLRTPTVDVELAYRLYAEQFEDADDLVNQAEILTGLNGILPTRYKDTVKVLKL